MEMAAKILIVGAVFNLAWGTVTGAVLANVRRSSEHASRYLVSAHVGPYMQGAMLLGLVIALNLSSLNAGLENIATALLVTSSVLLAVKDTFNWLVGVKDEFAERPVFSRSLGLIAFAIFIPGLAIVIIGVVQAL